MEQKKNDYKIIVQLTLTKNLKLFDLCYPNKIDILHTNTKNSEIMAINMLQLC